MRRSFVLLSALLLSISPAWADNVLRVVPQADLRVLDPHATQATITRIHAMMIYDQLYGLDEDLQPRPQMVGSEKISDDKLVYEFTLRPGLVWDNGQKLTTADVLASLPRAAKPATNILIDTRCDRNNYVGWPCSEQLEAMRTDLIDAPSPEKMAAYNKALWGDLPTILLGQYLQPVAWRKVVSGLPISPTLVFWNVRKSQ